MSEQLLFNPSEINNIRESIVAICSSLLIPIIIIGRAYLRHKKLSTQANQAEDLKPIALLQFVPSKKKPGFKPFLDEDSEYPIVEVPKGLDPYRLEGLEKVIEARASEKLAQDAAKDLNQFDAYK